MADVLNTFNDSIYHIPENKSERDNIKSIVSSYVNGKKIFPPVTIDALYYHAKKIASTYGYEGFEKFLMILLNNEIWKSSLKKVPYQKRILFLPQCLRNQDKCTGFFDELGLICESCGSCSLGDLQEKALKLGYSVLISEGTQVVINLIENGNFEAVIGVSCMSTLEKAFKYLFNGVIPGYAVPLYKDGCIDTKVDVEWLYEILETFDEKNNHIDFNSLKEEVKDIFIFDNLKRYIDNESKTGKIGLSWIIKSGNRWRPLLLASVYKSLMQDKNPLSKNIHKAAIAIECFHKASLIHDDIEDGDEYRYDEKTLQKEYNMEIALNAGDYLLGEGYRLLSELNLDDSKINEIIAIASKGHRDLSLGQGEELYWLYKPESISVEEVLNIFRMKTSPAFEVALLSGAIMGNADDNLKMILKKYSEYLGIAYQIKDDIKDSVIGERKPTIVNAIFLDEYDDQLKNEILKSWQNNEDYKLDIEINDSNIIKNIKEKASNLMKLYKDRALKSIENLNNADLKILLNKILLKITE